MSSKKVTKEELRTPDFFLQYGHEFTEFMLKYKSVFILTGAVLLVGALSWLGITYWQSHRENVAATAFYPVEKSVKDEVEKTKTVSDAAINAYEKVLAEHASTKSALVSLIAVTPDMIKANKAQVALSWFQKLTYRPSVREVHFSLMKMTEALLALQSHQPDQALTLYKDIIDQDSQKAFHAEAMLKSGIAYEMKNDFEKARETFKRVHDENPRTQAGEMAFEYLLYLDQKKGA